LGEPNCSADEVVEDIIASPSSGPSGPGNSDSGAADPGEPGEQTQPQQDKGQAQAQGKAKANGKVKARAKADAKVSAKAKSKHKPEAMKWPSQHLDYAIQQDIDWGSQRIVVTDKLKEKFPGLKGLTDREIDILATKGVRISEPSLRLTDTSQSIGRSGGHGGRPGRHHQSAEVEAEGQKVVGCITPRMKLWNTNQNRHIHGLEALNFQK
jgi:hypothetical protein